MCNDRLPRSVQHASLLQLANVLALGDCCATVFGHEGGSQSSAVLTLGVRAYSLTTPSKKITAELWVAFYADFALLT
jgi:hypothetical protein